MKSLVMRTVLCVFIGFLGSGYVSASGSGNYSHDHNAVEKSPDSEAITYKDSRDGIDAYLEFYDFKELTGSNDKGFLAKSRAKAYLRDSVTGDNLRLSKLVLRATIGHDQFGEAMVFVPANDDKMKTELFVKKKGQHHYLLIAEVEGVGVKEFHFHHTF
jgi:hypothetical protein